MEEFRAGNWTYTGEWKLDQDKVYSSPNKLSRRVPDYPRMPPSMAYVWHASNVNAKSHCHHNHQVPVKWGFKDAELKRQRRVVKYKSYAVEGKVKASLRSGFCWVKNKYYKLVHGY